MNATIDTPKPASPLNKPLWAAVGALSVAVLAMGATLVYIQTRPEEPRLAVLSGVASTATPALTAGSASQSAPIVAVDAAKNSMEKKAEAPVKHAQSATKSVANKHDNPAGSTTTAGTAKPAAGEVAAVNHPVAQVLKPICANCGTVESVTPIQRDGAGSGVGAVAGGVLGAVVGNQVGGGNGKTLATILGAVGGGVAGNAVEKKMKKETVYQVQVHMEDGSTRTLEQATPATVGAKVIVDGNTLQPASR